MITLSEVREQAAIIRDNWDTEQCHIDADGLALDVLRAVALDADDTREMAAEVVRLLDDVSSEFCYG